jgi:hypothetical protein
MRKSDVPPKAGRELQNTFVEKESDSASPQQSPSQHNTPLHASTRTEPFQSIVRLSGACPLA